MHAQERKEAFHEPAGTPRGFGVRQSSGAFGSGPRAQKRQRTAAVQDASAPAAASSRFMVPMHARKRKEAFHEPAGTARGFGVRQSSGAFGSGPRAQKRQRTAAVQEASAPAAASSRFTVTMQAQTRRDAFHEPAAQRPGDQNRFDNQEWRR